MMFILVLIGILVTVYIILKVNRVHVDLPSFFQPTLPLDMGVFGVYAFTGHQGSGKTYGVTKFVNKHVDPETEIYSNLTLKNIEYTKITSQEHLLSLRDKKNIVIIYDEILNWLNDKSIPKDVRDDLLEFLSQQRKMKNILLTTAQEWLNIPIEFRRFVRIQIDCVTRPLGKFGGLFIEEYFDGYRIKWSNIENDYIAPRISKKYSKYERRYMEAYDTYERIRKLARR